MADNSAVHFKLIYAKADDRCEACIKKRKNTFTDFMNPIAAEKTMQAIKNEKNGIFCRSFGGYEEAERKIIGFSLEKWDEINDSFPITALSVEYNPRFSKPLCHKDYLGSVLGLGLDRGKVGDIVLLENGAFVFVSSEIAEYIANNLKQVGNTEVKIKISGEPSFIQAEKPASRIRVSSLRLDAVISGAFSLSRSKSASLIEGDKVFVNWSPADNGAKTLKEGDTVTARGFGRIKVEGTIGKTKKDKYILMITKY